jgi:hypothetical protein
MKRLCVFVFLFTRCSSLRPAPTLAPPPPPPRDLLTLIQHAREESSASAQRQSSLELLEQAYGEAEQDTTARSTDLLVLRARQLDPSNPVVPFFQGWLYARRGDCPQIERFLVYSFSRGLPVDSDWNGLAGDIRKQCRARTSP